jgi:nicotinate phosphoribosyltransferase
MKFSDNPEKSTNPGVKQVWRVKDSKGNAVADVLSLDNSGDPDILEKGRRYAFWHPSADYRHFYHDIDGTAEALLKPWLRQGKPCADLPSLEQIKKHAAADLESFDSSYKRLLNPHVYKVSITEKLRAIKLELINNYLGDL